MYLLSGYPGKNIIANKTAPNTTITAEPPAMSPTLRDLFVYDARPIAPITINMMPTAAHKDEATYSTHTGF